MSANQSVPTAQTYLSFDCATKTFAFSICRVRSDLLFDVAPLRARLAAARALRDAVVRDIVAYNAEKNANTTLDAALMLCEKLQVAVAALDAETRSVIELLDGDVVDLAPGRADADVGTVDRLRAVAAYIDRRVRPALANALGQRQMQNALMQNAIVVIEYQMGPNARARAVAAALVALFAAERVIIVGPSLKNRIATCEAGRYGHFLQRYSGSYGANKAHAAFNFKVLEGAFGSAIPPTTAARRGHIADSCMQVLGHIIHGASEKDAAHMF
jgi:hypothetical protein